MNLIKRKSCASILALGLLVGVLLFFSPMLFSVGWHILYGSRVRYHNKVVPIPAGWIITPKAWSSSTDLTLMQIPRAVSFDGGHLGNMDFWPTPVPTLSGGDDTYRNWERLQMEPQILGQKLVGPIELGDATQRSSCFEALFAQYPGKVQITCLLFNGFLHADYIGPSQDMQKFYDVVRAIK